MQGIRVMTSKDMTASLPFLLQVSEVRLDSVFVFGCIHSSQPSHIYTVSPLSDVCGHTSQVLSCLQAKAAQLGC